MSEIDELREALTKIAEVASAASKRSSAGDKETSALSQLDFRVDRSEFAAGVVDLHLPVDAALGAIDVR